MSWYSERLRAFTAQHSINGTTMTVNGASIPALCPPKDERHEMQQSDFMAYRTANFTVKRTDLDRLNIEVDTIVEATGSKFQVETISDDDAEPCVDLKCRRLQ